MYSANYFIYLITLSKFIFNLLLIFKIIFTSKPSNIYFSYQIKWLIISFLMKSFFLKSSIWLILKLLNKVKRKNCYSPPNPYNIILIIFFLMYFTIFDILLNYYFTSKPQRSTFHDKLSDWIFFCYVFFLSSINFTSKVNL